jgi:VIT1/CCC1 family predicted Fe2+/Mn2+ transporter
MQQKVSHDARRDPFYLMYSRWCDWAIMRPAIDKICEPQSGKKTMQIPLDYDDPEMIGDARGWTKAQARRASLIKRFWFGIVGGLSLIAPMLLILLYHDRVTALVTASVATVLFATTMAFYNGADASPLALVGATAAYAAVLIVLVGTKL